MQGPYTYGPALLTSVEKCAFYLRKDPGLGRVAGVNEDSDDQRRTRQSILEWIISISQSFQYFCKREFLIQSRIQYFNTDLPRQEFFPNAVPIVSISDLSNDPLGLFTGGESVVDPTNYRINAQGRSFETVFPILIGGRNSTRLTYLGGLAYHGTQSTFTLSGVTGAANISSGLAAGSMFAEGTTSGAIARVIAYDDTAKSIVLDNRQGVFLETENLTFQSAVYAQDIPSTGATIASIDRQSLAEAFPDIGRALQMELRYMEKHEFDHENQADGGKYGATRRPRLTDSDILLPLQEETMAILQNHVRYLVGT